MEKLLRLISLSLALLMVCFTFCGCDAIEEMRKTHAVWKDKEQTVILLNGKEYKLLPECEELNPVCNSYYDYTVSKSEVPLLLAEQYGESISLSADKKFLVLENESELIDYSHYDAKIYCITDFYEEICDRINSSDGLEYLCYEYNTYDFDTDEYISKLYFLTEEESEAVSTVLKHGAIDSLYDDNSYYDYCIEIYSCSEDALFRNYAFDLMFKGRNAYLSVEYFSDDGYQTDSMRLVVPDDLYDTVRGIASEYIESMKY